MAKTNNRERTVKTTIHEMGNGFPTVGDYVPGNGVLYRVVSIDSCIQTRSAGEANYLHASCREADWADCSEDEEFAARVSLG